MPKLNEQQAQETADAEDKEFVLLDPGTYALELDSVEEQEGEKGPYWSWEFTIYADENGEELAVKPKVWENTSLSPKARFRLRQMFDGFGVSPDTDTDTLLGQTVWAEIVVGVARNGTRAGQQRNEFGRAIPAE